MGGGSTIPGRTCREDIAWAGGLFEGEGSFGAYRHRGTVGTKKTYFHPSATLAMSDEDRVSKFQQIVGVGKVHGPIVRGPSHHKPQWRWYVRSFEDCQAVAAMLWDVLGPRRREQIRMMLARMVENEGLKVERATHCKRGHEFTPENTYIKPSSPNQWRNCRKCIRLRLYNTGRGKLPADELAEQLKTYGWMEAELESLDTAGS